MQVIRASEMALEKSVEFTNWILERDPLKQRIAAFRMEKETDILALGFFQKMAPKSPPIFITFSDTY